MRQSVVGSRGNNVDAGAGRRRREDFRPDDDSQAVIERREHDCLITTRSQTTRKLDSAKLRVGEAHGENIDM